MRDRLQTILQWLPKVLGGVLGLQLVLIFMRSNPVADLEVPVAPRWHPEGAPAQEHSTHSSTGPGMPGKPRGHDETNRTTSPTNAGPGAKQGQSGGSNLPPGQVTNGPLSAGSITRPKNGNEPTPGAPLGMSTQEPSTSARTTSGISPVIQARIDKITQSEMLAPVFHPPPMALLGIAGHDAFLRTPNGQMSLLREGSESDGLKLLRIGTNRVLVEVAGEKKELMIFEGIGGESLLPK